MELEYLESLLPPPMLIPIEFFEIMGGAKGGIFLGYMFQCAEKNEWKPFSKTAEEIKDEICLSRREQESLRKRLVNIGVLLEKKSGTPSRIYYEIKIKTLSYILNVKLSDQDKFQEIVDSGDKRFHYIYKITHKITAQFYIGVRSSNVAPEKDVRYMGSGNWIREMDCPFNSILKKEIIETFTTRRDAGKRERELIKIALQQYGCMNILGRELL